MEPHAHPQTPPPWATELPSSVRSQTEVGNQGWKSGAEFIRPSSVSPHAQDCAIQFGHMFVLVFLNEQTDDFHERGKGVGFVIAHLVHEIIEQCDKALVLRVRVRDEDGCREFGPMGERRFQCIGHFSKFRYRILGE